MLSGCPDCGGNKFQFHPAGTDIPEDPPGDVEPPGREEPSAATSTVGRAATRVRDFVSGTHDDSNNTDSDSAVGSVPDSAPAGRGAGSTETGDESTSTASPASTDHREDPAQSAARSDSFDDGPDPNAPWPDEADDDDDDDIIDADARETERAIGDADEAAADTVTPDAGTAEKSSPSEIDASTGDGDAAESGLAAAEGTSDAPDTDGRVVSEPGGGDPGIAELREQLNEQFESIKIVEPGQYELNLMELYDREEYIIALQENGRYVIQVPENWMGEEPGER